MDEGRFVSAAILERCATAAGESEQDAKTLAIDLIAGRAHQPVTAEALAKVVATRAALAEAARQPEAATPTGKDVASRGTDSDNRTPAGRMAVGAKDAAHTGPYDVAKKQLAERPDLLGQISKGVASCLYAPELGRLDADLIARYQAAFVAITCAAEKHRDKAGKVDAMAHAQQAAGIFKEQKFTAAEFARLGSILGRFASIEKEIYDRRRAQCPDPRENAAKEAANGLYVGTFSGRRSGELRIEAKSAALTGTMTFAPQAKAKDAPAISWPLRGALSGSRMHLINTKDLDWIRLEGQRKGKVFKGSWQAEIGFKKFKGKWTLARPAPAAPAVTGSPSP